MGGEILQGGEGGGIPALDERLKKILKVRAKQLGKSTGKVKSVGI